MDYINLGKTGLKVSRICLGCMTYGIPPAGPLRPGSHAWALNEADSQPFFKQALDLGINFFDTANVYSTGSSEELLGRFLKANTQRENIVIATKLNGVMRDDPNGKGLSRKEIFFELDQSLKPSPNRLRRPLPDPPLGLRDPHRRDPRSPPRRRQSRQSPLHRRLVHVRLAIRQSPLHRRPPRLDPLHLDAEPLQPPLPRRRARDDGPLQIRRHRRHPLEPASPRPSHPPLAIRNNQTLRNRPIQQSHLHQNRRGRQKSSRPPWRARPERNVPMATLALAWMLSKPVITAPIVGATKPNHLTDAVAALSIKLTPEEIASLEEPYIPHPVVGFS